MTVEGFVFTWIALCVLLVIGAGIVALWHAACAIFSAALDGKAEHVR